MVFLACVHLALFLALPYLFLQETHSRTLLQATLTLSLVVCSLKSVWCDFLANVTTLRSLYAIAVPSVVCLSSVTLVRPTQPVEIFGNFFHHTIAQGL